MQTSNTLLKISWVGRCTNCESFEIKWVLNILCVPDLLKKQIWDTTFTHYFPQENYKTTAFFIAYFGLQPDQTWKWSYCSKYKYKILVTDQTFGSAELFGRTSTVRFGPNDKTFFCRTQNFFFIFLFCLMTHMYMALSLVFS